MEVLKVLALAVTQGITEFLPVSSSGHLIIGKHLLGLDSPGLRLEVVLHAGTLLAVCAYFWRRLWSLATGMLKGEATAWQMAGCLALATLPAVGVYKLVFKPHMTAIETPVAAACGLLVTGILLLTLRRMEDEGTKGTKETRGTEAGMTWGRALLMGIAQAVAILPGVSRSGTTVTLGRHSGLSREAAGEFAMLMSIPVILGSLALDLISGELGGAGESEVTVAMYVLGALVSTAVGFGAVALFMRVLKSGKFWVFGAYCLAAGCAALIFI